MTKLLMFEVDVKNVTEKGRREREKGREEGDQLGFGVMIMIAKVTE